MIAAGGIALAQTQDYLTNDGNPYIWMAVFAVVSLLSLVFYFLTGVQNWGMLFPSGIFAALAFLLWMSTSGVDDPAMASPLFIGIGLPFIVAYLLDRNANWRALIPAGILGTAGLLAAFILLPGIPGPEFDNRIPNALMYLGIAATFTVIWRRHNKQWAMLITILAACMAVANLFLQYFQQYWPLLVVVAGFSLLINPRRAKAA